MLRKKTERYQQGSIRRVSRIRGSAWEFRYYAESGGKRVLKTQTFDTAMFPTEKSLRQHLAGFIEKLNRNMEYARLGDVTLNTVLDRYIAEEMPSRHSTKGSYISMINKQIRPRWGLAIVSEIRPVDLRAWFQSLNLGPNHKRASA